MARLPTRTWKPCGRSFRQQLSTSGAFRAPHLSCARNLSARVSLLEFKIEPGSKLESKLEVAQIQEAWRAQRCSLKPLHQRLSRGLHFLRNSHGAEEEADTLPENANEGIWHPFSTSGFRSLTTLCLCRTAAWQSDLEEIEMNRDKLLGMWPPKYDMCEVGPKGEWSRERGRGALRRVNGVHFGLCEHFRVSNPCRYKEHDRKGEHTCQRPILPRTTV